MFTEHIKVLLGLDSTAVDRGLAGVEGKVNRTGKAMQTRLQAAQRSLRALALEFPVLGRLTELVFNPISLAVVGLVGAFKLWRYRVQELQKTFGETKIPDFFTTEGKSRIDAGAESWKKYRESVQATTESMRGLEAQHGRTMQAIQRLFDLMDELAGPSAGRDKEETTRLAGEKSAMAGRLSSRAATARIQAERIRQGLNTGIAGMSPASRNRLIEENRGVLTGAEADIKTRQERIGFLNEAENAGWANQGTNIKFRARYGGMGIEQARSLEMQMLARAEQQKRGAESRIQSIETAGKSERERMDSLLAQAAKDEGESAKLRGEANDMSLQGQIAAGVERLKSGRRLIPSKLGMGESTSVEAVNAIRSALAQAGALGGNAEQMGAALEKMGLGKKFGQNQEPQERTAKLVGELMNLAKGGGIRVNPVMGK
jgi:hypothetical protein